MASTSNTTTTSTSSKPSSSDPSTTIHLSSNFAAKHQSSPSVEFDHEIYLQLMAGDSQAVPKTPNQVYREVGDFPALFNFLVFFVYAYIICTYPRRARAESILGKGAASQVPVFRSCDHWSTGRPWAYWFWMCWEVSAGTRGPVREEGRLGCKYLVLHGLAYDRCVLMRLNRIILR